MKTALFAAAIALLSFAAFAPDAVAQEINATLTCQGVGTGAPEPLGDREGHSITVGQYSCRVDSGPMSGGLVTGTAVWEWDGPNAVQLSNSAVGRKPGATIVWVGKSGKLALTMTDGKVTGFTASGQGADVVATGSAASLVGKTSTWTSKSTGPDQFTTEETLR
jgi:hypothetical protein